MADSEPVLVKVLDAKSALDINAVFTGEVKKATQVWIPKFAATLKPPDQLFL
jgi:hypothetical protein